VHTQPVEHKNDYADAVAVDAIPNQRDDTAEYHHNAFYHHHAYYWRGRANLLRRLRLDLHVVLQFTL
jgi:hypothetical protein